jgi:hypothetical protein
MFEAGAFTLMKPAAVRFMRRTIFICLLLVFLSCVLPAQNIPVPFVEQPLVPASVAPGSGGFNLTVHGTGFAPTAVVEWNGSQRETVVVSDILLQATILASDVGDAAHTAAVTVVNLGTPYKTSNVTYFTVRKVVDTEALIADSNFSATGFVTAGDFNNDGNLDVAVCNQGKGGSVHVAVYLGNGKGAFEPPIESVFDAQWVHSPGPLLTGDFNGDHKLDLALLSPVGNVTILFGDGNGKFTLGPTTFGMTENPNTAPPVAADVDGDGNLDLIMSYSVPNFFLDRVSVWFGQGDGNFRIGSEALSFGTPNRQLVPRPVVGDFNEDGRLDLAVPDDKGTIFVALNRGDGTFHDKVGYPTPPPFGISIVAADVNGDGHLDLIASNGSILLGKGDGTFTNGEGAIFTGVGSVIAGDFNGDGKVDLMELGSPLSLALGNGDGTFQAPIETGYGFNPATGIGLGGFDLDGHLDLVGSGGLFWHTPAGLTPPSLGFGQQVVGTSSPPQPATLVNASAGPLSVTQVRVTGANSQNFSQTNNCPSSLPPGNSCQIQVTFTPLSAGDKSAALQVSYVGSFSPESVALSGTGVVKQMVSVSLTPAKITFPTQIVNTTSAAQTATLKNTGNVDVTISSISASAPFGQTNNCPSSLPVGQSCKIQVTFRPTKNGQAGGTLSVTDNAPNSPQTVALSGTGTKITLSPIGINFGSQKVGTSSNPVPVTLSNAGIATLNISKIDIGGTNAGDFSETNNCGATLPVGSYCTIQVTFSPKQTGQRAASLQVYDDVNPNPQQVSLAGTGT